MICWISHLTRCLHGVFVCLSVCLHFWWVFCFHRHLFVSWITQKVASVSRFSWSLKNRYMMDCRKEFIKFWKWTRAKYGYNGIVNLPVSQQYIMIQDVTKFSTMLLLSLLFSNCKWVTHLLCIKDTMPISVRRGKGACCTECCICVCLFARSREVADSSSSVRALGHFGHGPLDGGSHASPRRSWRHVLQGPVPSLGWSSQVSRLGNGRWGHSQQQACHPCQQAETWSVISYSCSKNCYLWVF